MWRSEYLPGMIDKYLSVGEVLIIDNSPQDAMPINPKAKIIYSGENIYVNAAWNMGYRKAKGEYLLLANDDIWIDNLEDVLNYLRNNLQPGQVAGPELEGELSLVARRDIKDKTMFYDWGAFIFLHKSDYVPVPKDLKVLRGDNWLWACNEPYIIYGVRGKHELRKTVAVTANCILEKDRYTYSEKYNQ